MNRTNKKFVYVLVSDGCDYFCEMTLLSIYSLRLYHSSDSISIVMDAPTERLVRERYGHCLSGIRFIVPFVPESYSNKARSRYLKTTLRQNIKGDFLYLDCDTLICDSLDVVDSFTCSLGGVLDYHYLRKLESDTLIEKCRKCGFDNVEGEPYFNSGVFYVKDIPENYLFFQIWHNAWLISVSKGYVIDQPALCQANMEMGHPIQELNGEWNCQMHTLLGKKLLSKAKILHYYTMNNLYSAVKERLLTNIKEEKGISATADIVARNPKTIGFAVFTSEMAGDFPLNEFIYSDLLYTYCSIRPLYNLLRKFARVLTKPALFLIRQKVSLFQDSHNNEDKLI